MNAIKVLLREDGSRACLQSSIKEEVVGFYRKLMGTAALSIPMVDKTIVEKGPLLQAHHQAGLCAPVSILEVKQAVFYMDKCKAPGIDGFTAHFYQSTWHITCGSVVAAVQDFFTYCQMPAQVNGTYLGHSSSQS